MRFSIVVLRTISVLVFMSAVSKPMTATSQQSIHISESGARPNSMNELCGDSELIVEGYVQAAFPAQAAGGLVSTDFSVHVVRLVKGFEKASDLVIRQMGGVMDSGVVATTEVELLKPGQRYIFFLNPVNPEREKNVFTTRPGLRRYELESPPAFLLLEGDSVRFPGLPFQAFYAGKKAADVLAEIEAIVRHQLENPSSVVKPTTLPRRVQTR
jgi:hypothetical protein